MRLRLVREPFDDPNFIFELKHDGFRAVAYIQNGECKILSPNSNQLQFKSLRADLAKLPALDAILDGEVVCTLSSAQNSTWTVLCPHLCPRGVLYTPDSVFNNERNAATGADRSIPEVHMISTDFGSFLKAISARCLTSVRVVSFS